jgi:hypothetical protein
MSIFFVVQQIYFTFHSDGQLSKWTYLAVCLLLHKVAVSWLLTLALSRRNIPSSLAKKTSQYTEKNIASFHEGA